MLTPYRSDEAIKQAILAGLGISALSRHALTLNAPGQFAVLDVVGFPILRHWYAVYPAGRELSVVARAFLDYLLGRGDGAPATQNKKKQPSVV
jgi:DNA-binding transcriptional LysR family regulator